MAYESFFALILLVVSLGLSRSLDRPVSTWMSLVIEKPMTTWDDWIHASPSSQNITGTMSSIRTLENSSVTPPIAIFTIYSSKTDQPMANFAYPLVRKENHWTAHQVLYISETGKGLNVKVEFNQKVHHVRFFWDGELRSRRERFVPYFIGGDKDNGRDVLRFFPLSEEGNHTMIARAMRTKTEILQDFKMTFEVFQAKPYIDHVLIDSGVKDEQFLSIPDRSYALSVDNDIRAEKAKVGRTYGLAYFQTLRKSEYRGETGDYPIEYNIKGLRPLALHRIALGFVETETAYCEGQFRKSYFIFVNGDLFDHAYNTLHYAACNEADVAVGYFPSTETGTITVSLISKFHPWETTVAFVEVELFHLASFH